MARRIYIVFDVEVPDVEHTDEQLEEWIRFELGDNGHMKANNPFEGHEPEPVFGTFGWEDK